jgi:hypothetical protein
MPASVWASILPTRRKAAVKDRPLLAHFSPTDAERRTVSCGLWYDVFSPSLIRNRRRAMLFNDRSKHITEGRLAHLIAPCGAIGDPEAPKAPWGAFWDHEDVGCGGLMTRRLVFLCPARASHYGTGFPPPVEYTCRRKNLVWVR